MKRSAEEMRGLQRLPLDIKVAMTMDRIRDFVREYGEDGVCVSFSGGKDSTVLLHLVRSLYPNVKAVFSDTGLEFHEIRNFVKTFDNVDWIKPKMTFGEIVTKYGYPLFSKEISNTIWYSRKLRKICSPLQTKIENEKRLDHVNRKKLLGEMPNNYGDQQKASKSIFNQEKWLPACINLPFLISPLCCNKMKKDPLGSYTKHNNKKPIVGTLAEESRLRTQVWIRQGCNAFDIEHPISKPLSFWTEQDILEYIKREKIEICSVYGDIVTVDDHGCQYEETLLPCGKLKCTGAKRTGCMYCAYGAGNEHKRLGKSRFELLAETHPKIYDYVMRGGQWVDNPYYDPTAPKIDPVDGWENWNMPKIWTPSKDGLGMKFVFDKVNEIYPDYIKY